MRGIYHHLVAALLALVAASAAGAQTVGGNLDSQAHRQFRAFYQSPDLARAPSIVAGLERETGSDWTGHPPIVGFLTGLLTKTSDGEALLPANPSRVLQADLAIAYSLAGHPQKAAALVARAGLDPSTARTPPLLSRGIRSATDLDFFWGAAFATGNPRYIQPILKRFVEITASEQAGRDVLTFASGPGSDDFHRLKERYTHETIADIALGGAILVALARNVAEHEFIRRTAAEAFAGKPADRLFLTFLQSGRR